MNRGGGLALLWKNSINLSVESFSKNHIDSIIDKGSNEASRFTGFYGEPDTQKSWDLLCLLNWLFDFPWLCAGDFTDIVSSSKKLEGSSRSQVQMQLFREAIDECGFIDLDFSGSQFTWQKHFSNSHSIWESLDRCLANNDWLIKFVGYKVHHLHCSISDHNPLWIVPDGIETARPSKPFRFEEMRLLDGGCDEIIEAIWTNINHMDPGIRVVNKIDKCGKALTPWSQNCFGSVRRAWNKQGKN